MKEQHIDVAISTPYVTLNSLGDKTKNIWFVCHGQGQLARYFIKKFEVLDPLENFVIAPQGISKYYLNGFTGRVGKAKTQDYKFHLYKIDVQSSILISK